MKQAFGLIIGLLVGAAGALMFSKSMPPEEGSVEERLEDARIELRRAERTIREFEKTGGVGRGRRTMRDGMRGIIEDLKDGKEVSADDLFSAMKPWLRDMSPLFDRVRELNGEDWADRMTGQWAREYKLTKSEQAELRQWFLDRSRERGEAFNAVVNSESSGFVDFVKATEYDWHDADGAGDVMEKFLEGEELEAFQEERLNTRVESVQGEADRGVTRLGGIVDLDEDQQVEAFAILVRGSEDYREGEMAFDGMGVDQGALDRTERNVAIRGILQPDQVEAFDTYRAERRAEAEKDMRRLGLTLPDQWDMLEGESF